MKYDYDKPTTCDHFGDVQVGDKIAVNLTDGSRIVGKVTVTTVKYVHVRSSAMTGGASFYRRDSNIESVELLERKFVPGLYLSEGGVLYRVRYNGHVRAVGSSGDGAWFDAPATAQEVTRDFKRIGD